jgi:membrane protein
MARLRDIPAVVRTRGPWGLLKRLQKEIGEDNLTTWAAAMAYSWLFAIFPFFIFLLSLVPYLPDNYKQEVDKRMVQAVYQLPDEAREQVLPYIQQQLNRVLNSPPKAFLSLGLLLTIWAASGGMAMTMSALDKCYDVHAPRPIWKQRPLAVALTVVCATMIVLVIVLIPIGSIVTEIALTYLGDRFSTPLIVGWQVGRYGLGLFFMFATLSLIYYWGANHDHPFHLITPGSVFVVGVWLLLGVAFRIYIEKYGKYDQTYGALGGAVILLMFFYLDSLVLLVGAEINNEVDCTMQELTGKIEPEPEEALAAAPPEPAIAAAPPVIEKSDGMRSNPGDGATE